MVLSKKVYWLCTFVLITALTSCSNDVEDLYSTNTAYFVFTNTYTVPTLNSSLNNMGEFTTIYGQNQYYYFSNLTSTDKVNQTALSSYTYFNMGLGGFIVGLPNVPEVGSSTSAVVCYDRVCPNCYRDFNITRALTLMQGGFAKCARCTRVYDLNNGGIISSDTTGIKLYRYRVSYVPYTLRISNR
jgi:hypothetical protein